MAGPISFRGVVPSLLAAGAAVGAVLAGAVFVGVRDTRMAAVASRIDKIEERVSAYEERIRASGPLSRTLAALERKVSNLETRVRYPRFAKHVDGCPQCRGDTESEDGGPPPLCEEGFDVWKSDMRAEKERR